MLNALPRQPLRRITDLATSDEPQVGEKFCTLRQVEAEPQPNLVRGAGIQRCERAGPHPLDNALNLPLRRQAHVEALGQLVQVEAGQLDLGFALLAKQHQVAQVPGLEVVEDTRLSEFQTFDVQVHGNAPVRMRAGLHQGHSVAPASGGPRSALKTPSWGLQRRDNARKCASGAF